MVRNIGFKLQNSEVVMVMESSLRMMIMKMMTMKMMPVFIRMIC